jgi:hypothetical protein
MKRIILALATVLFYSTSSAWAAISVTPTGTGVITFDTLPTVASGWSTWGVPGAAADIETAATVDAYVTNNVTAANVTTALGTTTAGIGGISSGIANWNSTAQVIYTKPTSVKCTVLMATLQNDSGSTVDTLHVSYDFGVVMNAGVNLNDPVVGHRVFFSLTGAAQSWTFVPSLSGVSTTQPLAADLDMVSLGGWAAGTTAYIIWVDDNGVPGSTTSGEGGFTIDNFSAVPAFAGNDVVIEKPTDGSGVALGVPVQVVVSASGSPTNITVYVDDNIDDGTPGVAIFSTTNNPAKGSFTRPLGAYYVYALAEFSDGTSTYSSTTNVVYVTVNEAPSMSIQSPVGGANIELGLPMVLDLRAGDTDAGLSNVVVRFNGVLVGTITNFPASSATSFFFTNRSTALGALVITATAQDILGATTTDSISVNIIENPPPTITTDLAILDGTTPVTSITVPVGSSITNFIYAVDEGVPGNIAYVLFYDNNVVAFSNAARVTVTGFASISNSFVFTLNDAELGVHVVHAVVYDQGLMTTTSAPVTITVTNDPAFVYLVTNSSLWKYYAGSTDPGSTWMNPDFDDSAWRSGVTEIGYGNATGGSPDRTHPDFTLPLRPDGTPQGFAGNSANPPTALFRKHFTVANRDAYTNLVVHLLRDDSAAVYLNGTLVYTNNMAAGLAFTAYSGVTCADDGTIYQVSTAPLDPSTLLVNGDNVVAVELHQASATSSDITFDLMLLAQGSAIAPVQPTLELSYANGNVTISWPDTFTGYTLKSGTAIAPPSSLVDSGLTPTTPANGRFSVTIPAAGPRKFFELVK